MKFREAYVSDMGAIYPDEAVINSILLKMRREIETPAPWIKRVPTMRLATAAACFCLLIAAAAVIPVLLNDPPNLNGGESEQNYAIADGGTSPAPMSPTDSPHGSYAEAYEEDNEAWHDDGMGGVAFTAPAISETQHSRSTYDADDFGIVAESAVGANEAMPGGGMAGEVRMEDEINSASIYDNMYPTDPSEPSAEYPIHAAPPSPWLDLDMLIEIIAECETFEDILEAFEDFRFMKTYVLPLDTGGFIDGYQLNDDASLILEIWFEEREVLLRVDSFNYETLFKE